MKRTYIIIISLFVFLVVVLIGLIYYFRYVSYPLDKEGMVYTKIDSLTVTWSGGFGTRASTQPVSIEFSGYQVNLRTELDETEGKKAEELVFGLDVDAYKIDELYALVNKNLWDIQHCTKSNTEIMDAGNQYLIINGDSYGGYAPSGSGFNEVFKAACDVVGTDEIDAFREKIYEWYGETR